MNAVKLKINDVGLKLLSLSIENVVFIDVHALHGYRERAVTVDARLRRDRGEREAR